MIQGIQIEMKSAELKSHIEGRAKFHESKAGWYQARVADLKAGGVDETHHSNDPTGSLQRSHDEHAGKAGFFRVLADHLVPDETYRLSENDLARLEFVSRYF